MKPYLQLDSVIAAAFDCANRLFGVSFKERNDLPVYHPEVRCFEVTGTDGRHVGLFLGDYFARPSKRSGAWMSGWREPAQARRARGAPDRRQRDELRQGRARRAGAAQHRRRAHAVPRVRPRPARAAVQRDLSDGVRHQRGARLRGAALAALRALDHAPAGAQAVRQALQDRQAAARSAARARSRRRATSTRASRRWSTWRRPSSTSTCTRWRTRTGLDVDAFEKETLERIGAPAEIGMRHRIPHFQHIIGGYASGYYSYMWSEVMDADAFGAFEEAGDIFDPRHRQEALREHLFRRRQARPGRRLQGIPRAPARPPRRCWRSGGSRGAGVQGGHWT